MRLDQTDCVAYQPAYLCLYGFSKEGDSDCYLAMSLSFARNVYITTTRTVGNRRR